MAFWSGDKLAAVSTVAGPIVGNPRPNIDCSALKLTLGGECFVTPNFDDPQPHLKQKLDAGEEVVVPPGQFAFLLTEETVNIPSEAMGFISLRSKVKLQGLINVSGFHVDPGYRGKLIYSVFNAGPGQIHIARGDPIFLLWLADLDQPSTADYMKDGTLSNMSISSDQISAIDRPLHSLQSLSGKVETLQSELNLLYRVLTVLAVIGGLVLAGWALLPGDNASSVPVAAETVS